MVIDVLFVEVGTEITPVKKANGDQLPAFDVGYTISQLRVDDIENRVYVAGGESGDIVYYDFDSTTDEIGATKHLVISRIHASDFVVDFCHKSVSYPD